MGKEGDATPFTDVTVDNISAALHGCGYQSRGWEVMYNGHTGRQLKVSSFSSCSAVHLASFKLDKHSQLRHGQFILLLSPVVVSMPSSCDPGKHFLFSQVDHATVLLLLHPSGV